MGHRPEPAGLDAQSLRDMRERADVWLADRSYTAELARDVVALTQEVERLVGCVAEARDDAAHWMEQALAKSDAVADSVAALQARVAEAERRRETGLDAARKSLTQRRDELYKAGATKDQAYFMALVEAWRDEVMENARLWDQADEVLALAAALTDARDALAKGVEDFEALWRDLNRDSRTKDAAAVARVFVEDMREVLVRLNQEAE